MRGVGKNLEDVDGVFWGGVFRIWFYMVFGLCLLLFCKVGLFKGFWDGC